MIGDTISRKELKQYIKENASIECFGYYGDAYYSKKTIDYLVDNIPSKKEVNNNGNQDG